MLNRIFISSFSLCLSVFATVAFAVNSDNPFARTEKLEIGKKVGWNVDKEAGYARKTVAGDNGVYYHLSFDNKKLILLVSTDKAGEKPKAFKQLNIKDMKIDGKRSDLFQWCLNNQERQNRFLQEGLKVRNNICAIDGKAGTFVMQLDKATLASLKAAQQMLIMLKPFRTPLELRYELSDFNDMYAALNAKPEKAVVAPAPVVSAKPAAVVKKICHVDAPAKYKSISSVSYECSDAAAKQAAQRKVNTQVSRQQEAEANRRKLAEEKRLREQAAKLKQEEKLRAEAAAIAASEAKQAQISSEIAQKMLKVCEKYWKKGEHRCYCQKYIEHAPSEIQANSTCE